MTLFVQSTKFIDTELSVSALEAQRTVLVYPIFRLLRTTRGRQEEGRRVPDATCSGQMSESEAVL